MITSNTTYTTSDGQTFVDLWDAKRHELSLEIEAESKRLDISQAAASYLYSTYNGQKLLSNHSLDEEGIWEIRGEDPNCDMGGYHNEPSLKTVMGSLRKAVELGVTLKGFYQWGGGGRFTKIDINKL